MVNSKLYEGTKTKKYTDWEKDLRKLLETCIDIDKKLNHIIRQTRDIHFALACLDELKKYSNTHEDHNYSEENGD